MAEIPLKAYEDIEFLKRDELRAVRLQTELLKAQIVMDEQKIGSTVCVFGGSRIESPEMAERRLQTARDHLHAYPDDPATHARLRKALRAHDRSTYYAMAREFSRLMSIVGQKRSTNGMREYVVTTGGGPGIMEAANRGATDVEAKTIGLNITLPHEQEPNPYITPELSFLFHYFSIRKMHFLLRAKALCAFPGGFGTMDELFETLTLIQTVKSEKIPVILFGEKFWNGLINWEAFLEWEVISPNDLHLFQYAECPIDGVRMILEFYGESEALLPHI